jgi:type VI secretion system secreted protein VgrG
MEREGIYYFFEHGAAKHTLVLVDSFDTHTAPPQGPGDPYTLPSRAVHATGKAPLEYIIDWNVDSRVEPGMYSHADFDFTKPRTRVFASRTVRAGYQHDDLELYDYPGGFVDRDAGEAYALVRLQEHQEPLEQATGWSNAGDLTVGCLFSLMDHPREDQNRAYLVTAATHRLRGHDSESGHGDAEEPISTTFNAIDAKRQFRSRESVAKPFVRGPQTAIVVGPAKEEIWTDKYGRVKVQFHWDREGQNDENSSCWVRVSQAWAGTNWGAMHIPRIGQEVIVDFLEGDPDRPIVTGRVYNNANMPPYELPKHQTQSGIKSRSSKGGFAQNANEIRFEDSKGHEDLFVHAENTHTTVVKGSQSTSVGGDRTVHVAGKETYSVDKTRTTTVKGDDSYFVTEGDVLEGFGKSHSNNVKEFATYTIGKNYGLDVGEKSAQASFDKSGDIGIANKKATIALAGGGSIEIKSDDGTITIKRGSTHIEIASDKITIDASAKVEIKGGSGIEASVGGSKMELTSDGATVTATMIKLNA